ncbi:Uncharacterised protein [Mycobacterium xenopi]|nr:Uncharacterised protein [Mycobacterium xenopi]
MVTGVFDDMGPDELAQARAQVAAAGLDTARLVAATRLVDGPAAGLGKPAAVVEMLMARDRTDARWERLEPFELRWALLVIQLMVPVMNPSDAVADARMRGASWAAIGTALGVTAQSAHGRFRHVDGALKFRRPGRGTP